MLLKNDCLNRRELIISFYSANPFQPYPAQGIFPSVILFIYQPPPHAIRISEPLCDHSQIQQNVHHKRKKEYFSRSPTLFPKSLSYTAREKSVHNTIPSDSLLYDHPRGIKPPVSIIRFQSESILQLSCPQFNCLQPRRIRRAGKVAIVDTVAPS